MPGEGIEPTLLSKLDFEGSAPTLPDANQGVAALTVQDRIKNAERRWQTLGMAAGYLLLLVAHVVGEDEDGTEVIGIVSARKADRKERMRYAQDR